MLSRVFDVFLDHLKSGSTRGESAIYVGLSVKFLEETPKFTAIESSCNCFQRIDEYAHLHAWMPTNEQVHRIFLASKISERTIPLAIEYLAGLYKKNQDILNEFLSLYRSLTPHSNVSDRYNEKGSLGFVLFCFGFCIDTHFSLEEGGVNDSKCVQI
jgi:hypothetical protein